MNLVRLKAKFPREAISWRAQSVTKTGDKAMALAYIDARDVMMRLDEVCGPENWQDEYIETSKGRVICKIGILVSPASVGNNFDKWVWKSDGAGNTDVEGEKGAISDAFKRAAVKWGIGRYLYDMPAPWVPCVSQQDNSGKFRWKSWKEDPWKYVPEDPVSDAIIDGLREDASPEEIAEAYADYLEEKAQTYKDARWLDQFMQKSRDKMDFIQMHLPERYQQVRETAVAHRAKLKGVAA